MKHTGNWIPVNVCRICAKVVGYKKYLDNFKVCIKCGAVDCGGLTSAREITYNPGFLSLDTDNDYLEMHSGHRFKLITTMNRPGSITRTIGERIIDVTED